jgi:PIN domain nuclease of toxin-antitoxin system
MNVLLDTCALLALARGDLPKAAAAALRTAVEANVSVVSSWEVAIKAAAGKLQVGEPPAQWFSGLVERYELREVPLDAHVACAAAALPAIHRDPFDRVLVALAQANMLTILTSDQDIPKYPGVKTLW